MSRSFLSSMHLTCFVMINGLSPNSLKQPRAEREELAAVVVEGEVEARDKGKADKRWDGGYGISQGDSHQVDSRRREGGTAALEDMTLLV